MITHILEALLILSFLIGYAFFGFILFYLLQKFKIIYWCIFTALLCFGFWFLFFFNTWIQNNYILFPTAAYDLFIPSIITANVIYIFKNRKLLKFKIFIPLFIFIVAFLPFTQMDKIWNIQEKIYLLRLEYNIPKYNKIIDQVKSGSINLNNMNGKNTRIPVPKGLPAIAIFVDKLEDNEFAVRFYTHGHVIGYLYYSGNKKIENLYRNNWRFRFIKPHWYRYAV